MTAISLGTQIERAPIRREERIPDSPRWWRAILSIPLIGKLAGANTVIVAAAAAMGLLLHVRSGDGRLLFILVGSLLIALLVNLALVYAALRPLKALEATAERVWKGDFEARVPPSILADRDIERVGRTFNLLLDGLIADRVRTRRLAADVIHAGDLERARVAHELHDSTAQALAALVLHLSALARDAGDPELTARVEMVRDLASGAMEEVRLLSHTVHPRVLDDLGLPAALRTLAREASMRTGSVAVEPDIDGRLDKLPPAVAAALYRVAQEAVSNAIRHGSPEVIRIRGTADDRTARLEITDDGSGFDLAEAEQRRPGMGIFAMRERVALVDGTIDIMSEPLGGTRIVVTVPLQAGPFTTTGEA